MTEKIDLRGKWDFCLDGQRIGIEKRYFEKPFNDEINLPSTTSMAHKGEKNQTAEIGCLTDEYKFEGYGWYRKSFFLPENLAGKTARLVLERTRKTTLWVNGKAAGSGNSLNTPHVYDISSFLKNGENSITILVDNTDYPTKGGHLTSPDTQTNWNGITGKIEILFYDSVYIEDIQVYPDLKNKNAAVKFIMRGALSAVITAEAVSGNKSCGRQEFSVCADNTGHGEFVYDMGEEPLLWSEYTPYIYSMKIEISGSEEREIVSFGMREFTACKTHFEVNGKKIFLRGKHDGMVFPLTGAAPTDRESWLKVFRTAKEYGINHYRFHTCCPPEEAFWAADIAGIYLEPELPFWGTMAGKDQEGYNPSEQQYLINEGFGILHAFGNHPSFCMFSMGNELWGSPERLNEIMGYFKGFDKRHLYTMGSNNFQFYPTVVENDDFFCGVRLSCDRLIRGSYASCDMPLGHIQTEKPGTMHSYDTALRGFKGEETEIRYGNWVRKVKVPEYTDYLMPEIPVVSHEIGQYSVYPDFREIEKYTGVLKAKNLEVFQKRLENAGIGSLAHKYFLASGKLAADCYKEEIESAMRSEYIAGFQMLDLQDFPGQGTALVGMLDSFMDSKGLISPEEWRSFCSDNVILGQFEKYVYTSGESFTAYVSVRNYTPEGFVGEKVSWQLEYTESIISGSFDTNLKGTGLLNLGAIEFKIPEVKEPCSAVLHICAGESKNSYRLWIYPESEFEFKREYSSGGSRLYMTHTAKEALALLKKGERVLLIPDKVRTAVKSAYCTDFWCYPMFRTISESMGKPVPPGTMGLLIDSGHMALEKFPCNFYTTPQWYNIAQGTSCAAIDGMGIQPIVRAIDNFERNKSLGILFEVNVGQGRLMVCTAQIDRMSGEPEIKQFGESIVSYCLSDSFLPEQNLSQEQLLEIIE